MHARANFSLRDQLPMASINSSFLPVPCEGPGLLCRKAFVLAPYFINSRRSLLDGADIGSFHTARG
jgi:hypothetical protein